LSVKNNFISILFKKFKKQKKKKNENENRRRKIAKEEFL
jgi:hypothetical protein